MFVCKTRIMKKLFIVISLVFLFASPLVAQDFWEEVTLPQPGEMVSLLSVDNNGTLYLGTGDFRFFYSSDNGSNWTESDGWPEFHMASCIGFNSSGDLLVGTSSNGMLRSTDGGATFTEINNGLSFYNVWDIDVNENDEILLATPGGIFRSTNNGDQWTIFGTGLPNDVEVVNFGNSSRVYAGTFESGMWRSDDNGNTWSEINTGLPDSAMVTALAVVPDTELFAGIFPDGLFHSDDYGNSWEPYNNGLPFGKQLVSAKGLSVSEIVIVATYIYIAVYLYGAYFLMRNYSADNPNNYLWLLQDKGLPFEPTTSAMAGGGPENKLFLGTYEQGMFRNAYPVWVEKIITDDEDYYLGNISPNPITTTTSFTFSVPETSDVAIKIYNLTGQEIETVLSKKYIKGSYIVNWTPQHLRGGVYFLNMETSNFRTTKKIIYLQ